MTLPATGCMSPTRPQRRSRCSVRRPRARFPTWRRGDGQDRRNRSRSARARSIPRASPTAITSSGSRAEAQHLTVQGAGGMFSLALEGQNTGAAGHGTFTKESNLVKAATLESGAFKVGETITSPEGNVPAGTTITKVELETEEGGVKYFKLTLSQAATAGGTHFKLTADDLPYNASPAEIQADLEALSTIGAANVMVEGAPAAAGGPRQLLRHLQGRAGRPQSRTDDRRRLDAHGRAPQASRSPRAATGRVGTARSTKEPARPARMARKLSRATRCPTARPTRSPCTSKA